MYDPFKDAEKRGEAQGRAIGEARLAKLLQKLYELGRTEDVQKAVTNKSYRDNLMKEFAIQQLIPYSPHRGEFFYLLKLSSRKGVAPTAKWLTAINTTPT